MLNAQTVRVDQAEQGTTGKLSVYAHGDAAQKNGALLECFDSRCQNCTTGGIKTSAHSSKTLRIHLLPCSHGICAECLTYQETILPKVHLLGNFVCYGCGLRYKLSDYMDIQPTKLVMSLDHSFDTEELQPIFQDEFQQHLKSGENSLDWFEDRSPKMSTKLNNGKPHASIEHYGGTSNKLFGRIDSPANGPARSSEYLKPPISPHQNNFGVRFHNDSKHTINEVSECISDRSSPFLTAEGIIGTSKPVKLSGQQGPLVTGPIPLNTIQNSAKLCKISVSKASMPKMKRNKPKNSVTAKEHKLSNRDTQQEPDSCGFRGFKNARFVGKKSLPSRAAPAGVKKAEDEELGFSTQSKESSDLDSTIIKGKSFGSGTRKKICDFDSEPEGEQHPQYRSEGSNSEDVIISIQGTGGARGAQLGLTVFDQSMQHMLRSQLSLRRVHGKTPNPLELQKIQTLSESDAANLFSSSKLYPRQDTGLSSSTQGKQRNVASATNKKKFDPSFGQTTEKLSPISKQKQSEPILNVKYSPLLIGKSYNRETIKSNLMIPTVHELNFEVPDFRKIQASRNAKSSERRPSEQSEYSNWGQARASQTSTLSTYKILDGLLSAPKLSNALSTHGPGPSGKPLSKPTSSKLDSSLTPGPHPVGSSPSRQSPPGLSSPKRHSATGFFQRTNEETSLLDLIKQRSLSRGSIEPPNRERELLEASWSGLGGFHHWPGSSPLKHPSLGQAGASGHKLIRPSPQPKQTDSHGKIRSLSKLINSIGG